MRVLKFGGTSVRDATAIRAVGAIVARAGAREPVAVVVSAMGGVTDALLDAARRAEHRDETYREGLATLAERHRTAARELLGEAELADVLARLDSMLGDLADLLHGAFLLREASPRALDGIASYGERLSAVLVAAALRAMGIEAEACDARNLVVTDDGFGAARVEPEATEARIRGFFAVRGDRPIQVVTGFVAATADGRTTTLGRGGSDYTASLLGAALGADAVELWTDVDAVMTADPRLVPGARAIERLSYEELMELSHFGAKVVHPPSVHPTRRRGIPLWIKNTFRPEAPGTVVSAGVPSDAPPVRGITSIRRVALLRLEGDGMVGVPGIASRLFGALAREKVSLILISQASSEHSICFAVAPGDAAAAARAVDAELALERRAGMVEPLVVEQEMAVVAVVGAGMAEQPGTAGRLYATLGEERVNVRAIAQGSSELNISTVVDAADEARAVRALHAAFLGEGRRVVEVALAGAGRVGSELLRQLAGRQAALAEEGLEIRLVGVGRRTAAIVDPAGLDPATAVERLRAAPVSERLETALATAGLRPGILVDATASEAIARGYEAALAGGSAVVTANKLRLAGALDDFRRLRRLGEGRLYFETTVGAGLPILGPLAALVATGDRLRRVDGVLSGTLAFVAGRLEAGATFSAAVREAHQAGYTEPDPREDLGGRDVVRKLVILARVAGLALEATAVAVEPLLPAGWDGLSLDAFWRRLPELDAPLAARVEAARENGRRLLPLASLEAEGSARLAWVEVGGDHPAAGLRGTDNLVAVTTDRYPSPLVVRGPGAGPAVTAAGLFADLLRAAAEGAPRRRKDS